jgi:hypothetical protein
MVVCLLQFQAKERPRVNQPHDRLIKFNMILLQKGDVFSDSAGYV